MLRAARRDGTKAARSVELEIGLVRAVSGSRSFVAVSGPCGQARERLVCTGLTGLVGVLLLVFGPAPGDAAVHLYRTLLVQHGTLLWDNYWYAGQYPLASYSLVYYLPAAVVGNAPLVLAAAVASSLLFASIAREEWGDASLWPARIFGVCAAAPLFTGLYSYSLGFMVMLGALRALQLSRVWVAVALAGLTLGCSPLAFLFLCLILLSVAATRGRLSMSTVRIGVALLVIAAFELCVLRLFPSRGIYPFHLVNLAAVVAVSIVGMLLARRARNGGLLVAFFGFWGVGSVVVSMVGSPIGDNWTRLNEFVFPLMVLTAALARFRPRVLVSVALAGALAYNLAPYLLLIPYRLDGRPATARYWQPAIDFVKSHSAPGFRVEVVPTASHWESYWIPRAGIALARGWYRQLDLADNPILYSRQLDAASYRLWLREEAVDYVLLPSTKLDPDWAPEEASLLRSGRSGLSVAFRDRNWTIYRLPNPTPLITGPGSALVTLFGHTRIGGLVSRPGRYLMRSHYMPFWKVSGRVCLLPGPDGMTWLQATTAGRFSMAVSPTALGFVQAATSDLDGSCPTGVTKAKASRHV